MKRFILVIAVAFLILGCSMDGGDSGVNNNPIDKWVGFSLVTKAPNDNWFYEFKSDGTWSYYCIGIKSNDSHYGGTFTYTDTFIDLKYEWFYDYQRDGELKKFDALPAHFSYTIGESKFWPDYSNNPNEFYIFPVVLSIQESGGISRWIKK